MHHQPHEYRAIYLWHKMTGSYAYYIEQQQNKAVKENAPLNAIYQDYDTKQWVTVDELAPDHAFRESYKKYIQSVK